MKNDPHVTEVSDDGALLKRYRNEIVDLKRRLNEVGIVIPVWFPQSCNMSRDHKFAVLISRFLQSLRPQPQRKRFSLSSCKRKISSSENKRTESET